MAKEAKSNSLFGTELNGFKKKQVNEYIVSLENKHKDALEAQKKTENELRAEIANLNSQYTELLEKYNDLQNEKAQVASVLINAEKSAAKIIEEARGQALVEKEQLSLEAEEIRRTIVERNGALTEMQERSNAVFNDLIGNVKSALASFEEYIAQGRLQLSSGVADVTEYTEKYTRESCDSCNEFDIEEEDLPENELSSEEPESESLNEDIGGAAEFVFAEMQARDDGVDLSDFDSNFTEMRLDEAENDAREDSI